jgi:hypothetical protein
LKRRKRKLTCAPLAPFELPYFFPYLFLQRLSWGSADTLALPTELTQAREVEVPRRWRLLVMMRRVLSGKSPSSRVNLRSHDELVRWPRRSSAACPMHWLMVRSGWWSPRWSTRSSLGSFLFCELRAPSCVLPLLAHHG